LVREPFYGAPRAVQKDDISAKLKIGEDCLKSFSVVLVGLGLWLIDGVLSIVKYPKQSFPEQLIRLIRATVGVVIVLIAVADN
jgi:hypothetical protein